ncbi:MAG: NAD(P)-dependent oxidoreductase [Lentisphaerae bacterium]|nr:NAD(P)-dependent oxidoreductase [Lentisphaerota bacterium]
MKVVITGACGFIGRKLIEELEQAGHELRLVDKAPPEEATIFLPTAPGARGAAPFKTRWPFVKAEIMDAAAITRAVEGCDAMIHLAAAVTGLPEFGIDTFHVNACGTYIALEACRLAGVKRFLCASSINAFGTFYWRLSGKPSPYSSMPLTEAFEVVPEDSYSLGKYVNELTCATFHRAFGTTTAAFRFAAVWSDEAYEATRKAGLKPTTKWADDLYQWVHRSDVVRGIRQALEQRDLPGYGAYTLSAADTTCPEPTMEILRRYRPDLAAVTEPLPGRAPLLSIAKAQRTFGYAPRFRLGA